MNYWIELELIIPNHSINLTMNLLTKEIKQNMEEHLKLFEEYTPELEGNVEYVKYRNCYKL